MPDQLPAHVGRIVDEETGYALVCTAVRTGGDPDRDPLCSKPAQWHVRWEAENTENDFACDDHLDLAMRFQPFGVHSVENSACGMPGSFWVESDSERSRCQMDALDEDPDRSGHVALEASHA